jgi:hypothetical protein
MKKKGILLENVFAKEDQRPTVMWRSTAVDCQDAAKIVIFPEPSEIWDISATHATISSESLAGAALISH